MDWEMVCQIVRDAFLHDLYQIPQNFYSPSISLPISVLAVSVLLFAIFKWSLRTVLFFTGLALTVMGIAGIGYAWGQLTNAAFPFLAALDYTHWRWEWMSMLLMHAIEAALGAIFIAPAVLAAVAVLRRTK